MGWEVVTSPKRSGGLGICKSEGRNLALLGKFAWRVEIEDRMWARVIRNKYCQQIYRSTSTLNSLNKTAMEIGGYVCSLGTRWIIGNGGKIDFWGSEWLRVGSLRSLISGPFNQNEEVLRVSEVLRDDETCDFSRLSFELPLNIREMVVGAPTSVATGCDDSRAWKFSTSGTFDTSSTYELICGRDPNKRGVSGIGCGKQRHSHVFNFSYGNTVIGKF